MVGGGCRVLIRAKVSELTMCDDKTSELARIGSFGGFIVLQVVGIRMEIHSGTSRGDLSSRRC